MAVATGANCEGRTAGAHCRRLGRNGYGCLSPTVSHCLSHCSSHCPSHCPCPAHGPLLPAFHCPSHCPCPLSLPLPLPTALCPWPLLPAASTVPPTAPGPPTTTSTGLLELNDVLQVHDCQDWGGLPTGTAHGGHWARKHWATNGYRYVYIYIYIFAGY